MRKLLPRLLMTLAAVALPQIVRAQGSSEPPRPSAESLFKRLDVNKDGFITPDEIPAGMPERQKQMLIDADKKGDKKITLEELKAAFQERAKARQADRPEAGPDGRPGPRGDGQRRMGPPQGFGGFGGMGTGMGMPEMRRGEGGMAGRPGMGPPSRPEGRPGPEQDAFGPPARRRGDDQAQPGTWQRSLQGVRASLPELPNLKTLFDRLDTDKDGKLSFDEFKVGMTKLHQFFAARLAENRVPTNRMAGRPDGWQSGPWPARRHTGWEPAGRPGPQFRGYAGGWYGHGRQFRGYAQGWYQGRGPQFRGYGPMGPGPQFRGYAQGWYQGRGPQFRGYGPMGPGPQFGGYADGWHRPGGPDYRPGGPQFRGPGPMGAGPQFDGYAMNPFAGRGPQFQGPGIGWGSQFRGPGPEGRGFPGPGPGPQGRGPRFDGSGMGRGPQFPGSWQK